MSVATLCTKILSRSTVILATLVLSSVVSNAQVDSTIAATIPNSEEFLIDGPNGRKLRIQISHPHPDDPSLSLPIQDQKPVPIFVLDGGLTFGLFSTVARYMQWGGELPPSLVIGVGYEDEAEAYNENYRLFDFTPANPSYVDYDGNISPEKVGGGEAFREFLLSVLMPKIYETYEVDQENSVLFGHSLGGLFFAGDHVGRTGFIRTYPRTESVYLVRRQTIIKKFRAKTRNLVSVLATSGGTSW